MSNTKTKKYATVVAKGNNLIQSHYEMELNDSKMVFLAMFKMKEMFPMRGSIPIIPEGNTVTVELTREEIIDFMGWQRSHSFYEDLYDIGDRLTKTRIELREEKILPNGKKEIEFTLMSPYPFAQYRNGVFKLEFAKSLNNQLGNFDNGEFTLLDKESIKRVRKSNTLRLYEILKRAAFRGSYVMTIADLRQLMFVDAELKNRDEIIKKNKYTTYAEFNRSVLKPCIKEINDVTDITVEAKPRRVGHTINSIEFVIEEKRDNVVATTQATEVKYSVSEQNDDIARLARVLKRIITDEDISQNDIVVLLMVAGGDEELVLRQYENMQHAAMKVEIRNKMGWLTDAIRSNYDDVPSRRTANGTGEADKAASLGSSDEDAGGTASAAGSSSKGRGSKKAGKKPSGGFGDFPQREGKDYSELEKRKLGIED